MEVFNTQFLQGILTDMQTVIVPIDFTDRSRAALNYAVELYHSSNVRFIFLHAYTTINTSEFLISIDDIIENDIRQKLEAEAEYLSSKLEIKSPEFIFVVEKNDIISALTNNIIKYNANMVILGSAEGESWNDVSNTHEGRTMSIVKNISLPCLIVPVAEHLKKPDKVMFATVLNGIDNIGDVEALLSVVNENHSHLDIVSVASESTTKKSLAEELKKTVNGYFENIDFELHTVLDTDTYGALGKFSDKHHSDLICIMYRKHGILEKMLKRSVSKQMFSNMDRPILALKHSE